jgi:hypothetical protein
MRTLITVAAALPLFLMADAPKGPAQPVPFSHKTHAEAGIRCNMCHPNAAKAERAGLPEAARCMTCHTSIGKETPPIRQVAAFEQEQKPIPWVRLYRLPDFVFFSHSTHVNGKVACTACHGPVEQRETLAVEVTHNMKTCMACHSERGASNKCHVCHELGQ